MSGTWGECAAGVWCSLPIWDQVGTRETYVVAYVHVCSCSV